MRLSRLVDARQIDICQEEEFHRNKVLCASTSKCRVDMSAIGVGNRYENRYENKGLSQIYCIRNSQIFYLSTWGINKNWWQHKVNSRHAEHFVLTIQYILFLRYVFNRHEYKNVKSNTDACNNLLWLQLIEFFNRLRFISDIWRRIKISNESAVQNLIWLN